MRRLVSIFSITSTARETCDPYAPPRTGPRRGDAGSTTSSNPPRSCRSVCYSAGRLVCRRISCSRLAAHTIPFQSTSTTVASEPLPNLVSINNTFSMTSPRKVDVDEERLILSVILFDHAIGNFASMQHFAAQPYQSTLLQVGMAAHADIGL